MEVDCEQICEMQSRGIVLLLSFSMVLVRSRIHIARGSKDFPPGVALHIETMDDTDE